MIGGLLVQHTVAMEVMSSKVEFLLEPPKLWQQDVDTEVRKCSMSRAYPAALHRRSPFIMKLICHVFTRTKRMSNMRRTVAWL